MTEFSQQSDSTLARVVLWTVILLSVCCTLFVVSPEALIDDAFISFRYARNLADGLGLVYNAGEVVEGYTNFLWTMVANLGIRAHLPPIRVAQVLSVLANVGTLLAVYRLGSGTVRERLVAPAFLACNVAFLAYPMSGMETTLHMALLTAVVLLYHCEVHLLKRGPLAVGLILLMLSVTRFDGFVLVGILLAYRCLVMGEWKITAQASAVLIPGTIAYHLWRFSFYPTPLPNTFYAKVGFTPSQVMEGGEYLYSFAQDYQFVVPLVLLALFAVPRLRNPNWFLGWTIALHLAYVAVVGGDWMPNNRFVLPVLPLIYVLTQDGLWRVVGLFGELRTRPTFLLTGSTLALLLFLNIMPIYVRYPFVDVDSEYSVNEAPTVGKLLNELLPKDALVAMEWGGIAPFYMKQPVLELFGLADREITNSDLPPSTLGRWVDAAYIAQRAPQVVAPCLRLFSTPEEAELSVREGGCKYRDYLELVDDWSYEVCVVESLRGGEFWPAFVRNSGDLGLTCANAKPNGVG